MNCWHHDEGQDLDVLETQEMGISVRRRGAEVVSLRWRNPEGEVLGLLWRDGDLADPPRFWKSHAPILFPAVGGLHDNQSRCTTGEEVRFPGLHGFLRRLPMDLAEVAVDQGRLVYRRDWDPETLAMYPWRFRFQVAYRLEGRSLEVVLSVTNHDTRPMPFQVGWHPGFRLPLRPGAGTKADCRLTVPEGVWRLGNDDRCFLDGTRWPLPGGRLVLAEEEWDRTCMLDFSAVPPDRRVVAIQDPDGAMGIEVAFPDMPHLGLWSDAGAPFACIEPWQGMDDHVVQEPFDQKVGIVMLPPGATTDRHVRVQVWAGPPAR